MVYNTRDYWFLLDFVYIVPYSKGHNVSEIGSVSVLRCLPPSHLRFETNAVSETVYSLVLFRISGYGRSPETKKVNSSGEKAPSTH
jgi:hypothetical protein